MIELLQSLRRVYLRWQLRSLECQAREIVEARNLALMRLMQIRQESDNKEEELLAFSRFDRRTTTA